MPPASRPTPKLSMPYPLTASQQARATPSQLPDWSAMDRRIPRGCSRSMAAGAATRPPIRTSKASTRISGAAAAVPATPASAPDMVKQSAARTAPDSAEIVMTAGAISRGSPSYRSSARLAPNSPRLRKARTTTTAAATAPNWPGVNIRPAMMPRTSVPRRAATTLPSSQSTPRPIRLSAAPLRPGGGRAGVPGRWASPGRRRLASQPFPGLWPRTIRSNHDAIRRGRPTGRASLPRVRSASPAGRPRRYR